MKIFILLLLMSFIPLSGYAQGPVGPIGPQTDPSEPTTDEKTTINLPYKPEPDEPKPVSSSVPKPVIPPISIPYVQSKAPELEKAPDPNKN